MGGEWVMRLAGRGVRGGRGDRDGAEVPRDLPHSDLPASLTHLITPQGVTMSNPQKEPASENVGKAVAEPGSDSDSDDDPMNAFAEKKANEVEKGVRRKRKTRKEVVEGLKAKKGKDDSEKGTRGRASKRRQVSGKTVDSGTQSKKIPKVTKAKKTPKVGSSAGASKSTGNPRKTKDPTKALTPRIQVATSSLVQGPGGGTKRKNNEPSGKKAGSTRGALGTVSDCTKAPLSGENLVIPETPVDSEDSESQWNDSGRGEVLEAFCDQWNAGEFLDVDGKSSSDGTTGQVKSHKMQTFITDLVQEHFAHMNSHDVDDWTPEWSWVQTYWIMHQSTSMQSLGSYVSPNCPTHVRSFTLIFASLNLSLTMCL